MNNKQKKFNGFADKIKGFDYKTAAEGIKEKAENMADKAKQFDYKGKAEEIKEAASNYDYKGFAENVKNYDYKGEAENIKKGGFKYFWSKHKKLSIGIAAVLAVGIVVIPLFNRSNTDTKPSSNEAVEQKQEGETDKVKYETDLTDNDIINAARNLFDSDIISDKTPVYVSGEVIGQDKYGRCAAKLTYDFGGLVGAKSYLVFIKGIQGDKIFKEEKVIEETMNNSQITQNTIKIRKEQYNWDEPR